MSWKHCFESQVIINLFMKQDWHHFIFDRVCLRGAAQWFTSFVPVRDVSLSTQERNQLE